MKKTIAFLLSFVMLFGLMISINVQAGPGGTLHFTMSDVEISASATTVRIPVSLQNQNATSINIVITYDAPLTFVGATFTGIIPPTSNPTTPAGTQVMGWTFGTGPATHSGVVFELEFSVPANDDLSSQPVVTIQMGNQLSNMFGTQNTTVLGDTSTITREPAVTIDVDVDNDGNVTIDIQPPEIGDDADIGVDDDGNIIITLPPGTDVDEDNVNLPGTDWDVDIDTDDDGNTVVTIIPPPGYEVVEYPPGSGNLIVRPSNPDVIIDVEVDDDGNVTVGIYPPEVEDEADISIDDDGNIVITLPPNVNVDGDDVNLPGTDWDFDIDEDDDGNIIVTIIPPPGYGTTEYPPGSGNIVTFLWGDVDRNGVVDAVDALLIDQWLMDRFLVSIGFDTHYNVDIFEPAANVSMTGTISALDSLRIRQYVFDRGLRLAGFPARYNATLGPR